MRGADSDVPLSDQVRLAHAVHHYSHIVHEVSVWQLESGAAAEASQALHLYCLARSFLLMQVTIQTFSQAIASAKEQLARSLLK